MISYARPSVDMPDFRDSDGQPIDYGNRWHDSAPDDAYSVESNLDRFEPLHAVADSLIAHLSATYDVEVESLAAAPLDDSMEHRTVWSGRLGCARALVRERR